MNRITILGIMLLVALSLVACGEENMAGSATKPGIEPPTLNANECTADGVCEMISGVSKGDFEITGSLRAKGYASIGLFEIADSMIKVSDGNNFHINAEAGDIKLTSGTNDIKLSASQGDLLALVRNVELVGSSAASIEAPSIDIDGMFVNINGERIDIDSGNVSIDGLKGPGEAYVCVHPNGVLFRSSSACN